MNEENTARWATALLLIGVDDDGAVKLGKAAFRSMNDIDKLKFAKVHKNEIRKFVLLFQRKGLIS